MTKIKLNDTNNSLPDKIYPVLRSLVGSIIKKVWVERVEGLEHIPVCVNPCKKLHKEATSRGWKVMCFKKTIDAC